MTVTLTREQFAADAGEGTLPAEEARRQEAFARKQDIAFRVLAPALLLGMLGTLKVAFTAGTDGPSYIDPELWVTVRHVMSWACPALLITSLIGLMVGLAIEDRENVRRERLE